MIVINSNKTISETLKILGERFRDNRILLNMTRKEIAAKSGVGLTTIYNFETGRTNDISAGTLIRLLQAIKLNDTFLNIIPDLPESPYLYKETKRKQRVKHKKDEIPES